MGILKRYIWWTEPRGNLHYDVMVTVILLFIFVTPRFIDYKDKPAPDVRFNASEVLVRPAGTAGAQQRFVYEVRKEALRGATDDAAIRANLLRVIQPIAGAPISLTSYQPVLDTHGQLVAYDATILR